MKTIKSVLALMGVGIAIMCWTTGCISVQRAPADRNVIVEPPPPAPVVVEPAH